MKKLLIFFLALLSLNAHAAEEILNFHSEIQVNTDRSITVTETIRVQAEGYNIQRGILRDIPTTAKDDRGRKVRYDLEVFEVLKDNEPENYTVSGSNIGKNIRIGNADIMLSPGVYTYTIKYKITNQVRFFEDYDELYWNVTGNGWNFTIQQASATVHLPSGAEISQHKGYSGSYGDSGCDCSFELQAPNTITYKTNGPLYPYQGLTIAIGWNKGVIPPPTEAELRKQELMAQLPLIVGIGGMMVVFFYYLLAWFRVGKDPRKGAIIPRFSPPDGFSPAASRFVVKMGFDKKAFTASIVSMAVKGFLTIEKTGKDYELIRMTKDESMLSEGEKKIAHTLFRSSDSITIKQSNHSRLSSAIRALEERLKVDFMKINFKKNIGWMVPGILLSIVAGFALVVMNMDDENVFFSIVISFFVSMFLLPVMIAIYQGFKSSHGVGKYIAMVFLIGIPTGVIILAYMFAMEFDQDLQFVFHVAPYFLVMLILIGLNILFFYLIKAPTVLGRKRMDEIEGLKMYMEVAEKHRLNMLNPPDMTPQLFEKLLPYAIALDVENEWGKQFDSIIEKAIQNNEYNPTWYSGRSGDFIRVGALTAALGTTFSSAVSSASVSPQSSSSSGSGGGGFSGGGGGGGGGGGW